MWPCRHQPHVSCFCVCVCEWRSHVAHVASFCRPLQIPSYLPACFLFACLLFLPPALPSFRSDACGSNRGECRHTQTDTVTAVWVYRGHIVSACETKLFGVISNKASRLLSSFPLIGFSFLLRPISVKMPGGEECGWVLMEHIEVMRLQDLIQTHNCSSLFCFVFFTHAFWYFNVKTGAQLCICLSYCPVAQRTKNTATSL